MKTKSDKAKELVNIIKETVEIFNEKTLEYKQLHDKYLTQKISKDVFLKEQDIILNRMNRERKMLDIFNDCYLKILKHNKEFKEKSV